MDEVPENKIDWFCVLFRRSFTTLPSRPSWSLFIRSKTNILLFKNVFFFFTFLSWLSNLILWKDLRRWEVGVFRTTLLDIITNISWLYTGWSLTWVIVIGFYNNLPPHSCHSHHRIQYRSYYRHQYHRSVTPSPHIRLPERLSSVDQLYSLGQWTPSSSLRSRPRPTLSHLHPTSPPRKRQTQTFESEVLRCTLPVGCLDLNFWLDSGWSSLLNRNNRLKGLGTRGVGTLHFLLPVKDTNVSPNLLTYISSRTVFP